MHSNIVAVNKCSCVLVSIKSFSLFCAIREFGNISGLLSYCTLRQLASLLSNMDIDDDDQDEHANTSIYDDSLEFGYFNMAHGMLVEITEELHKKFPDEKIKFSLVNTLYLAARSSQMMRFVEALNTISSKEIQVHLVNTVSCSFHTHSSSPATLSNNY